MVARRALIVTAVAVATGLMPAHGSVDVNATHLAQTQSVVITQEGDWVIYDYQDSLGHPSDRHYAGQKLENGDCRYSGTETIGPNTVPAGAIIEERETRSNLNACEMTTEVGVVTSTEAEAAGESMASFSEEAGADAVSGFPRMDQTHQQASVSTKWAWHQNFYEDPPGWHVNGSETNVTWQYDGDCVTSSWGHRTDYQWLWVSGWNKDSSSTTSWRGCSYARTTSNSYFSNGSFCVGFDTHTEFTPNEIKGQEDGGYTMSWSAEKSGGCNWLLSFHRRHGWNA